MDQKPTRGDEHSFVRRGRADFKKTPTVTLDPLRVRVATYLLYFSRGPLEEVAATVRVLVKISQDDLSALIGVSRQNVNKELVRLDREGIVDCHHGKVTVRDFPKLMTVAAEEESMSPDMKSALFDRKVGQFLTSD